MGLLEIVADNAWLLIVAAIVWGVVLLNRHGTQQAQALTERDKARDARWLEYIGSFKAAAKTKREQQIIDTMLAGGTVNDVLPAKAEHRAVSSESAGTVAVSTVQAAMPATKAAAPLDGTLLLLYFGAFLFVASAGLFVAFGGFSGIVRLLLIVLTMTAMYAGGLWLYGRSQRLRPAGVSFAAIGLAIAPLVGLAAYNYLPDGIANSGPTIWLLTSVLCAGLYAHALYRLRTTLLPYLCIASFVSLFESGIAVLDLPAPYFFWGLLAVGMLLRALSISQRLPLLAETYEPADRSAQLLVPLSTFAALILVPDHGAGQMAVALLLAAMFYSLEAYASGWRQRIYMATAHVLYVAAAGTAVFGLAGSSQAVAAALLMLALLHAAALCFLPADRMTVRDAGTVAFGIAVAAVVLGWSDGLLVSGGLASAAMLGLLLASIQQRLDAFVGGAVALIAIPVAVGQLVVEPGLVAGWQSLASFAAAGLLVLMAGRLFDKEAYVAWRPAAAALCLSAALVAVLPAWTVPSWVAVAGTVGLSLTLARLAQLLHEPLLWTAAGGVLCLPVMLLLGLTGQIVFGLAVAVALCGNLAVAVWQRLPANHWLVAGLALLLPVAAGNGAFGLHWQAAEYSYAYLAVMSGLVVCRSLAKRQAASPAAEPQGGKVVAEGLVHQGYIAGYTSAAILATVISVSASSSHLHTSVVLAVLLLLTVLLSVRVEARREVLALSPWLLQLLLWSVIRPGGDEGLATLLAIIGEMAAIGILLATDKWSARLAQAWPVVSRASLLACYVPVVIGVFHSAQAVVLPALLAVAGVVTLQYYWNHSLQAREWSGAVITLAGLWLLADCNVESWQAYSHLIAATFAVYAYGRFVCGEQSVADDYLKAMFLTATVPLALQALAGNSGDLYGWGLILQQVGFMIVGLVINRKFLVWWGLYVSVAAVLYQLRHLGWAALTLLAVFVISVAIYRLQARSDDNRPDSQ